MKKRQIKPVTTPDCWGPVRGYYLTPRQSEVCLFLSWGWTIPQIARHHGWLRASATDMMCRARRRVKARSLTQLGMFLQENDRARTKYEKWYRRNKEGRP